MNKVEAKNVADIVALTPQQESLLFHHLENVAHQQYHIQMALRIRGALEAELFERAWRSVVQSNELLRVVFRWLDIKQPVQIILKEYAPHIEWHDPTQAGAAEPFVEELRLRDQLTPFDLQNECYRLHVCRLADDEWLLLLSIHHIIYDGWSNGILWHELFTAYSQLARGQTPQIIQKPGIKSYVKQIQREDTVLQQQFWAEYLDGIDTTLALRQHMPRSTEPQPGYTTLRERLPEDLQRALTAFLRSNGLSLANLIYTAWGILLQRYCDSAEVVFGRVSSGRQGQIAGIERMIGPFMHVHPLRFSGRGDQTIAQCLHQLQNDLYTLAPHEATPLYEIKRSLGLKQRGDLFNTLVVVENYPLPTDGLENSPLSVIDYSFSEANHYDLTFSIEAFDDLAFTLIYRQSAFESWFIERLLRHLITIMRELLQGGLEQTLADLRMLDEAERQQILVEFNDTARAFPEQLTVIDFFEEQVRRTPQAIAITYGDQTLTYHEFNLRVNQLAHYLNRSGVQPGDIVGILANRSFEMLIGIFAVLKAGAAYLPIDPAFPHKRIDYLLRDANVGVVILHDPYAVPSGIELQTINLSTLDLSAEPSSNSQRRARPDDLCYVIYTSGTTGNPKGALIEHRSLVNRLCWMQKNSPIGPGDRVLQKTIFTFDVSVWELIWWSMQGATLCLLEQGGEKNPQQLVETIAEQRISVLHFVPSMLHVFLLYVASQHTPKGLTSLRSIVTSGEALTPDLVERCYALLPHGVQLINLYGPTEATIDVSFYNCAPADGSLPYIPIGQPIDNTVLVVLGPHGQLQPVGVPGQLYIGGVQLARGYLNQPELTASTFITSSQLAGQRLYATGDRAYWLPNGQIVYLGRLDQQVKLRGYRIELGEIEAVLRTIDGVKDALVLVKQQDANEQRLHAYLRTEQPALAAVARSRLAEQLPDYMVPSFFTALDAFPTKANGKVDLAALAQIDQQPLRTATPTALSPSDTIERLILGTWSEVLGTGKIGLHDNYFDVGGNSINLIRVYGKLHSHFGERLTITTLFQYPTVAALASYLRDEAEPTVSTAAPAAPSESEPEQPRAHEIAVIGMAGRFPGAEHVTRFWENLSGGVEAIHFFSPDELQSAGVAPDLLQNPNYVGASGRLEGMKVFDAAFFGYSPAEAQLLDPQLRIFLECVWETLEDAGYAGQARSNVIGLFAGASPNLLWETGALQSSYAQALGFFAAEKLANKDHLAAQIAYRLDLSGPVVNVYTACSTSLVAVHLACQALEQGSCEIALAGGVSAVAYFTEHGYVYEEGMVFSPDGHCRAFDKDAQGFVGGMGAGAVALKRLDRAIADGDNIYAVIKGTAITNDGNRKIGYTGLSVEVQAKAVRAALAKADVAPETIEYIETHGPGTALGDPLELQALELAFGTEKKNYCAVGSVKTNIGHLDTAAGIAGLIKTVLALKHKQIPPTLNFQVPNPKINFIDGPFFVNTDAADWEQPDHPRRASVNSLGLGGTNAHVVLEEYMLPMVERMPERSCLLLLSAKSQAALAQQYARLHALLARQPDVALADVAYTLQVGRESFAYRTAFVCSTVEQARAELAQMIAQGEPAVPVAIEQPRLVFILEQARDPEQLAKISAYRHQPTVQHELAYCWGLIDELQQTDLRNLPFDSPEWQRRVEALGLSAIVSLSVQYAVARWLLTLGIRPAAYIGDRLGEFFCACLAGVLSIEEALVLALRQSQQLAASRADTRLAALKPHAPTVPLFSHRERGWITRDTALDHAYWSSANRPDLELPAALAALFPASEAADVVLVATSPLTAQTIVSVELSVSSTASQDEAAALGLLGRLWQRGVRFDPRKLYGSSPLPQRITLPTYPFEHQEYWMPRPSLSQADQRSTPAAGATKQPDLADWFYVPAWEYTPLHTAPLAETGPWLIFATDASFTARLIELIRERGSTPIVVQPGTGRNKLSETAYAIAPEDAQAYSWLLDELERSHGLPAHMLHAWSIGEAQSQEQSLTLGYLSVLLLAQAFNARAAACQIQLNILSQNSFAITGSEELQPHAAMLSAAGLVISQEMSWLRSRHIDLVPPAGGWQEQRLAGQVYAEICAEITDTSSAYRGNRRWTRTYKPVKLAPSAGDRLRTQGVYLLVGGLGGVGLELSRFLAQRVQARLVLVGRSPLPPREEWQTSLERADLDEATRYKISSLLEIEQLGGDVCVLAADATSEAQMTGVMQQIQARYGRLDGVVYAAAEKGPSLFKAIADLTIAECGQQWQPKLAGPIVLERVLGDRELDFCIMMSSTSSVLGGLGFAAYAAANAFMDAFTLQHNQRRPSQWQVVNWETWDVPTNQNIFGFQAEIQEFAMQPHEGLEVFRRIVDNPAYEQLVVSSGQLSQRLDQWVNLRFNAQPRVQRDARPRLSSDFLEPTTDLEQTITQVWREFFGIDAIGVNDNLFELGATSLSVIQLSQNLRQRLNQNIPIVKLFTYPTISTLAAHLASAETPTEHGRDRSEHIDQGRNSARMRLALRKK